MSLKNLAMAAAADAETAAENARLAREAANSAAAIALAHSILGADVTITVAKTNDRRESKYNAAGDDVTLRVEDSDGDVLYIRQHSDAVYGEPDYVLRRRPIIGQTRSFRITAGPEFLMPPSERFGHDPGRAYQFRSLAGLGMVLRERDERIARYGVEPFSGRFW